MRKALSVLLLIVLLAPAALAQSDEVVTIRVWGGWGHFRETTFQRVVEAFEAAHPNIRVEQQQVTGDMEGLMVQLLGGVAPDVYMVRAESMPLFISEGLAMDITPFVERDLNLDDYLPAWGSMTLNGRFYGMPAEGGGYREDAMFINKDIFLKAGIPIPSPDPNEALTFDEWTSLARRLTIDVDGDGNPEQWGTHFRTTRWYFFLPSNGVSVFNDDHTDTLIDTPEAIEVLEVLQHIYQNYNSPDTYMFEHEGNVAMNIYWRARVSAGAPENIGDKFDWTVAPMPAGKAGSVGLTKMNPWVINPSTQHPEEAWAFLRFFMSEEGQRINAEDDRAVMLRSVALAPEFLTLDRPPYTLLPFIGGPAVDAMQQFEPAGVTRPKAVNDALNQMWRGEIAPQTAAQMMAEAWRAALSGR
ncbi:MAG: sugar ABC transporter substrate-binding protein [Firmicutes bacterium]|nr:sugar ABC transporter substrate-binding protein [Bacillota bacterium]